MTILKAGSYAIDNSGNDNTFFLDLQHNSIISHSATKIVASSSSGDTKYVFTGTNFGHFKSNGSPQSGTITGIAAYSTHDGSLGYSLTHLHLSVSDFDSYTHSNNISGFYTDIFSGADTITGSGKADTLYGYDGSDAITGGAGADKITPGAGSDTVIYEAVSDSTSSHFDTIRGFDFDGADKIDFSFTVHKIETRVGSGTLSKSSFDHDLAHAINASHLGAHDAVLFTPNHGTYAGETFLIVDANGSAGYQAGHDYVIELDHSVHLSSLDVHDFE